MTRNIALIPWFLLCKNLVFWQPIWFLYLQGQLSAADAIVLFVVFDLSTLLFEVPSGYFSDRVGRKITLLLSAGFACTAAVLQAVGGGFAVFAFAQILLGAGFAFLSGTSNALLFESLKHLGRETEIERQELRVFRFGFVGLALSALLGGILAYWDLRLAYAATALGFAAAFGLGLMFQEPPTCAQRRAAGDLSGIVANLNHPTLLWLFCYATVAYGLGHLTFVLGQPFIDQVFAAVGWSAQVPLVAGGMVFAMMGLSLLASTGVVPLRRRFGVGPVLVAALGLHVAIAGVLAIFGSAAMVWVLVLRQVPSAFTSVLVMSQVQRLIQDDLRATYVSLQSLTGRLVFAASLAVTAAWVPDGQPMALAEIQTVLFWYAVVGVGLILGLMATLGFARFAMDEAL